MRKAILGWVTGLVLGSIAPVIASAQISKAPQVRIQGTWWPTASSGHPASSAFPFSSEATSAVVRRALEDNQILVKSEVPADGVIVTEFQYPDAGRRATNISIVVRRFSYTIQIVPTDATHSEVRIATTIESGMQPGWNRSDEVLEWRDTTESAGSGEIGGVLRHWLLEQIERASHKS